MFKIGSQRLTWMEIQWFGLDEEGVQLTNKIEMQVELVDRSALNQQIKDEQLDEANAYAFAAKVSHGWKGVGDLEGKALPYSKENLALIWEAPSFSVAWGAAYLKAWAGMGKEREKNSASLPAGGQAIGQ